MTLEMQQVYYILWAPHLGRQPVEGLTKAEIVQCLELIGQRNNQAAPWEKVVPVMVKMGLLKKGNKRHCTVKNKEDVVWTLTDLATPVRPKANKPSAKQFVRAVAQLESIIAHHTSLGDGFVTDELRKLHEWIRDKVPEPKQ